MQTRLVGWGWHQPPAQPVPRQPLLAQLSLEHRLKGFHPPAPPRCSAPGSLGNALPQTGAACAPSPHPGSGSRAGPAATAAPGPVLTPRPVSPPGPLLRVPCYPCLPPAPCVLSPISICSAHPVSPPHPVPCPCTPCSPRSRILLAPCVSPAPRVLSLQPVSPPGPRVPSDTRVLSSSPCPVPVPLFCPLSLSPCPLRHPSPVPVPVSCPCPRVLSCPGVPSNTRVLSLSRCPPARPLPTGAPRRLPRSRQEAALRGRSANPAGSRRRGRAPLCSPFSSSSSSSCCSSCRRRRRCRAPLRLASPELGAPALPLLPASAVPARRAAVPPPPCPAMLQCKHAQEFSFGPRALKDALISTDPMLQELYAKAFSRAEKLFLSEAYNPQRTLFCTLLIRTAFDWLLSHPDAPEDFETFYHAMLRRKQNFCRKHIYLQPIDLIEGPAGLSLLDSLQSCVESFFLGLRVKCLPSIPVSSIHCCFRHSRDSDRVQLHADGILNFLKNNKPMDALCVLGLTLLDLYPCETWSFTFSKFLPGQEVGVCSFARFSGDFPQAGCSSLNPPTQKEELCEVSKEGRDRTLQFSAQEMVQCCKVTCHEICHLMGLGTCRWLQCIMQGALSLDEALLRPLEPCPICLRKLQHVVGFKLIERYRKLYAWTQTVLSTWPRQESAELSASEDILPVSSDSGMCCENDSEAVTSLSEPLTPDTCSQGLSLGPELEQDEQPSSLQEGQGQPRPPGHTKATDTIKDYELWLEMCIAALERNVSEEELAQVDKSVDALAKWEMFTGQLPAMRKDLPFARDSTGLRKVLGDKFSSLRRKLSSRKLSKGESSPHRWRWEDN